MHTPSVEPETLVIPLAEERIVGVAKEMVITGRVRVQSVTEEITQTIREDLAGETVSVERVRFDKELRPGEPTPQERTEGNVHIIPIYEEILVVERRLILREEVRVTRTPTYEHVEQPVTLRKQRAIVERLNNEGDLITEVTEPSA